MAKTKKSFFLMILASLFLLSSICVGVRSSPVNAETATHTEKVIAVVYDNSGSMLEEDRSPYAKYALQTLISVVGENDKMSIFPLNPYDKGADDPEDDKVLMNIPVDLSNPDREAEIEKVMSTTRGDKLDQNVFTPNGQTPPGALTKAETWLREHGMNTEEVVEAKEYWLIILSDGDFKDDNTKYNTSKEIYECVSPYVGLQTIFFGMGAGIDVNTLEKDMEKLNCPITTYKASSTAQIKSEMEKITNQLTGRYSLPLDDEIEGNQVTVDLSSYDFSVSSIAVLAQGDGEITLEEYSSDNNVHLSNLRPCSIFINEEAYPYKGEMVTISGYSSVIKPAQGFFGKDKITLTFNTAPTSVTILVEPAIKLEAGLQYLDNGVWKDTTPKEINSTLEEGKTIRTSFKLVDGNTDDDLTHLLDGRITDGTVDKDKESNVTGTVSYDTSREYAKGFIYDESSNTETDEGFKLVEGKKEVVLSVKVKMGESEYTLYDSWVLEIDEDLDYFRVDGKATEDYGGDPQKVKVDYTVIYDNQRVDKTEFESRYKVTKVEIKDPQGNDVAVESKTVNSDGTISIIYKTEFGVFGSYRCKITVERLDNGKSRPSNEVEVNFYPTSLSLSAGSGNDVTMTTNQFKNSSSDMQFTLTANGQPLSFDSSVIGYSLKINGVDKTSQTSVDKNVLKFTLNAETVPSNMHGIGDKNIELKVWSTKDSSVTASATSVLKIVQSTYIVEVTEENNPVDIYNLENCGAKIFFKIKLDGNYLTATELQEGLNNGSITIGYEKFGWITLLPGEIQTDVVEKDGVAQIRCSLTTTWAKPLASLFGSFISTGDKQVTLAIAGNTGVGVFSLSPVGFVSRLWRWIVILLIIYFIVHLVLWIIGFFIVKSVSKGMLVKIKIKDNRTAKLSPDTMNVNLATKYTVTWHLKRFIPFKEFMNQPAIRVDEVEFYVDKESKAEMMELLETVHVMGVSGDTQDEMYEEFINFRERCKNYRGRKYESSPEFEKNILSGKFKSYLEDEDKVIEAESSQSKLGINEKYYAFKDKKGKVKEVMFFIASM